MLDEVGVNGAKREREQIGTTVTKKTSPEKLIPFKLQRQNISTPDYNSFRHSCQKNGVD